MNKKTANFLLRKVSFLSAIFFLTILFSCKKDGKLTPDFDDGNYSILFTDTLSLYSTILEEDSLRADLAVSNLLGLYNDPIFGPTSSSIYTQVILTGSNLNFGQVHTIDSVVLTLDYVGIYGDTSTPMSLNVYELNPSSALSSSTDYYSNTYISHDPTPLGSLTFTPNLTDNVILDFNSDTLDPHLRIKLSNTWGQSILDADTLTELKNNTLFTDFMKGLYITTVDSVSNTSLLSGTGSILTFNMNSSLSTLTLYYNDSLKYDFTINSEGVKYSRFNHDYTGTDLEQHLNSSVTRDSTVTYVSTLAGVKTKIEIPNIKELAKEEVIINKAEIIFTVESGSEGSFDDALSTLSLVGINADGDALFLPDFFEGFEHYGGIIDESTSTKTYTFNISRHIHQLIYNTTTDYGMYLIANGSTVSANRSVISSEHSPNFKIKLEVTYSKL